MYPPCLQEVYTFTNNMVTFGDQEITEFYKSGKQKKLVAFVTCSSSVIGWHQHALGFILLDSGFLLSFLYR